MAAIGQISRNAERDILNLDTIEEILRPLRKNHDSKEYSDWQREAKNLLAQWSMLIKVSETVDKTIKTHVDNHMDKTKENIKKLEERMKDYL